jgi:hypothetical protein
MSTSLRATADPSRPTGRIAWLCARRPLDAQARFAHRVERMERKGHYRSLQLDPVRIRSRRVGFEVPLDLDLMNRGTIPEDADRLADDPLDIERRNVGALVIGHSPRMPDRPTGAGALVATGLVAPAIDRKPTRISIWN